MSGRCRVETVAALQLHRSLEQAVCMIGISFACAHYLPLSDTWPFARRAFILCDVFCQHVFSQACGTFSVEQVYTWYTVDSRAFLVPAQGAYSLDVASSNSLYTYFTPGSTGMPKGVQVAHGGFVNLLHGICGQYNFHSTQIIFGLSTACTFDPFGRKLWLCTGLLGGRRRGE